MKNLKIALLGATFLISASAAQAADLGRGGSLKDEPVYEPIISWTGFYLGGHLGGTFGDSIDYVGLPTDDLDSAFVGGVQVGYNAQVSGNLVLGIEADLSASGADYTDGLASIRGRIGLAAGRTLFYATGGVAFLAWDDDVTVNAPDTTTGWVAGLGVDYKLTQNLSFGVEGLYYSFSDTTTAPVGVDFDRDMWAVRARLNYHFGADRGASLK